MFHRHSINAKISVCGTVLTRIQSTTTYRLAVYNSPLCHCMATDIVVVKVY